MAQNTVRAGVDTYALYGQETTYGSEAGTIDQHFGIVQNISPSLRNNMVQIRGLQGQRPTSNTGDNNPRDALKQLPGRFEGTVTVEFQPQHFKWLEYALGSVSGTGTAADNAIYPQATATTDAEKLAYVTVPSMTLSTNYMFGGSADATSKAWKLLGCKVTSCTIQAAVGEPVSVSIELQVGNLAGTTTLETEVALDSADVYYFVGANVEYPTGTDIPNIIEGFELTITNDIEQLHGCGPTAATRAAKAAKEKTREYSLSLNLTAEGTQIMDDFMGSATAIGTPAEIASITLALTGDTNHSCDIVCYACVVDDEGLPQTYPEVVKENPTLIPRYVVATEQFSA